MKDKFLEYNPLEEITIKALWDNAVFVFDANVILNLYRYSDETSKQFLKTITDLKGNVWIPYQVGLEFNKNRLNVISEQKKHYEDFEKHFAEIVRDIENNSRNPFLSDQLFKRLVALKTDISSEFIKKIETYDKSLSSDLLLNKINTIFKGKVGTPFDESELKKIFTEGERRYKEKTPPGYCDIKKPDYEKYGDLVLWKEIIGYAKTKNIDIIFISDDKKEDWWLDHKGKTISARPELLKEFRIETNKNCHFYKPFQFLEYSSKYLGGTIKAEVIDEVKNHITDTVDFYSLEILIAGEKSNVEHFARDLQIAGYSIKIEFHYLFKFDQHQIILDLPAIPDLQRRLHEKYISKLNVYGLKLMSLGNEIAIENI